MHSGSMVILQPHWSCEESIVVWDDRLDLPKLATLTGSSASGCDTFRGPRHITLESDSPPTMIIIRHAPSHNCHSDKRTSILLQEWRHNPRKHPLHPSLTPRHRSSSALLQLITERYPIYPICATHNKLVECHSGSLGSTDRSEWYSTPWVTGTQSGRLICWVYDSISLLDPHILILHKERPLVVWYTSDIW